MFSEDRLKKKASEKDYSFSSKLLASDNRELALECLRLREALKFYGNKKHIIFAPTIDWTDPPGDFNLYDGNYIEEGGIARDSLGEN